MHISFRDPISILDLSMRTHQALRKGGVHSVEKLLACTEENLLDIKHIGEIALEEIRTKLDRLPPHIKAEAKLLSNSSLSEIDGLLTLLEEAQSQPISGSELEQEPLNVNNPIDDLNLKSRTSNALKRAGIHHVGSLIALTEEQLLEIREIGMLALQDIRQKIEDSGIYRHGDKKPMPEEKDLFIGRDGLLYADAPLSCFSLPQNILDLCTAAGISRLSQVSQGDLKVLKQHGLNITAVNKIIKAVQNVSTIEEIVGREYQELVKKVKFKSDLANELALILDVTRRDLPAEINKLIQETDDIPVSGLIFDIGPTFQRLISITSSVYEAIQKIILTALEIELYGLTKDFLLEKLPLLFRSSEILSYHLEILTQQGIIMVFKGERYLLKRMHLMDYIQSLESSRNKEIVLLRLSEMTLEDIAHRKDITRERVRQICWKQFRLYPTVTEDLYMQIFETYQFDKIMFTQMFDEPISTLVEALKASSKLISQ